MIAKDIQEDYNTYKDDTKASYDVSIPSILAMYDSLSDQDYRVLTVLMSFFNQYGETYISNKGLSENTNRSERSITRIIGSLKKQGYITVDYEYKDKMIVKRWIRPTDKLEEIKEKSKTARGIDKGRMSGIVISGVENKNNIINKNKEYIGEFKNVGLTDNELTKLNERFGVDLTNRLIEKLSTYIQSSPQKAKKYKSHYSVLIGWVIESVLEHNPPKFLTPEQLRECEKKFSKIGARYQFNNGKFYLR